MHFKVALAAENDPWVQGYRPTLLSAFELVQTHLAKLEVTGGPAGAEVFVDGQAVGKLPLPDPVRVPAGTLDVELRAPGFANARKAVVVSAGGYERVFVSLTSESAMAPPRSPSPPVTILASPPLEGAPGTSSLRFSLKWISWGAGAIGLGAGVWGVVANHSRAETFNSQGCRLDNDGVAVSLMTRMPDTTCDTLKRRYEFASNVAIAGFVAGTLFASAGAVLLLTEPKGEVRAIATARCRPDLVLPAGLSAQCSLRF
jgi:hypothetical protein